LGRRTERRAGTKMGTGRGCNGNGEEDEDGVTQAKRASKSETWTRRACNEAFWLFAHSSWGWAGALALIGLD
jgi:hypothetical protein